MRRAPDAPRPVAVGGYGGRNWRTQSASQHLGECRSRYLVLKATSFREARRHAAYARWALLHPLQSFRIFLASGFKEAKTLGIFYAAVEDDPLDSGGRVIEGGSFAIPLAMC